MTIELGVMRHVIRFTGDPDVDEDADTEMMGSLIAHQDPTDGELFVGVVVTYTLDAGRLRDLLQLAADGADIEGLIMSLDALALMSHQHADPDDEA